MMKAIDCTMDCVEHLVYVPPARLIDQLYAVPWMQNAVMKNVSFDRKLAICDTIMQGCKLPNMTSTNCIVLQSTATSAYCRAQQRYRHRRHVLPRARHCYDKAHDVESACVKSILCYYNFTHDSTRNYASPALG